LIAAAADICDDPLDENQPVARTSVYLHEQTHTNTHTQKESRKKETHIHAWSRIRAHNLKFQRAENSKRSLLRPEFKRIMAARYYYAYSQNCEIRPLVSSYMSIRPHGTSQLPLEEFLWNLIFGYFSKNLSRKFKL